MAALYCGTSGFAYPAWKPDFYPDKLPAKKFLSHYATRLNAVEINYTFHRTPSASTVEGWLAETPPSFRFALKAHQRLTHFQRLARTDFTRVFFAAIDALRIHRRLAPVLLQLPPNLPADAAKLNEFLGDVPEDVPLAIEFRHPSWFTEETYALLERRGLGLCRAESDQLTAPERITAPFVYFRLRKSEYPSEERAEIAGRVRTVLASGHDAYVFFKHEDTPAGALFAEELLASVAAPAK